jgi:broad specificity phosphatase PhoE
MKILNKSLKVPEYIHGDLIERYMGALEGLTEEEWHKLDQQTLDQHLEPKHDVEKRTLRVLQEILSCEGIPCIVTHSNIVRMIAQLTGCKIKAVRQQVFLYFEPVGESDWEMTCIE